MISSKSIRPKFDKEYQLKAKCNGFKDIITEKESLPDKFEVTKIDYHDFLQKKIFPNEIYINESYYEIEQHSIEVEMKTSHKGAFFKVFLSDQNILEKEGVTLSSKSKEYFIDYYSWECSILETKNSENLLLNIPIAVDFYNTLSIYSISETYLLYELSYAEYDFVVNTTYLLTPNNIFSNMNGGIGLFAGYTSRLFNF